MEEPRDWDEIRRTYPYMEKICTLCVWSLPTMQKNDLCRLFTKEVVPQNPACDYFVNRYVQFLI